MPAGGIYRVTRDVLDDTDAGALACNERRGLFVTLETPSSLAASYGTGARDAGTQRVTVATDDLVPISAAALPLPSGAATSAGQLADGHNVAVKNGAAGAAVNVQDGGNDLSIDIGGVVPTLATGARDAGTQRVTVATDDLVPISAAALPLPSGAATIWKIR